MKFQNEFSNKILFNTEDVSDLYKSVSTSYCSLSSYVQSGKLARIRRNLYAAINPMTMDIYATKFEIATKIVDGGYVAYHSALEYWGLHTQVFNTVYVAADNRFSAFDYDGVAYQRIASKSQEGVQDMVQNTLVRVTDSERTIVDCIDRLDLAGGLEELISAMENVAYLDEAKLIKYLDMYNLKFVYKKAGYLFSRTKCSELSESFYAHCKARIGSGRSYLIENREAEAKLNDEWGLIVPTDLVAKDGVYNG